MSVTGLAGMYNIKNLHPQLYPPEEIFVGTPTSFRLSVQNSKRFLPSFLIRLENHSGQFLEIPVVAQNSSCEGDITLTFSKRGRNTIGRIMVSSPYPVGFFTRYWSFEISNTITVFPRPIATDAYGSGDESLEVGAALNPDRGQNGELERISPYSGSEPLRMIHWKHSARSDNLLVKGFGRYVTSPLMIDLHKLPAQGIEERLSKAAWLVRRWVHERPVGLLLGDHVIPAGIGRLHGYMLLEELALYDSD